MAFPAEGTATGEGDRAPPDLMRAMLAKMPQAALAEEFDRFLGAGRWERSEGRQGWRNGTKRRRLQGGNPLHRYPAREMMQRRITAMQGVLWWGLPVAVGFAIWFFRRAYPIGTTRYLSLEFGVILLVSILAIGVGGGRTFARMLNRHGGIGDPQS